MPNEVGRCGTTATLVYCPLNDGAHTGSSLSPAPLKPSDRNTDVTIGPRVHGRSDGCESATEPVGAESVCPDDVLPTATRIIPTPESIRNAADVSSRTFLATYVNFSTGMVAQHGSQR
jgi:hypothetical protein